MQHERPDDPRGDELEELERRDRLAEHAPAPVIPLASRERPTIDVDRLERERAAAGPRPIRSTPARLAELGALERAIDPVDPLLRRLERQGVGVGVTPPPPRLVVAGDIVDELERQHRRAYHRRQEARARAARRRAALRHARDVAILAAAAVVLTAALIVIGPSPR